MKWLTWLWAMFCVFAPAWSQESWSQEYRAPLKIALGVTQFLRSVLLGVSPADPVAYATVSSLLLGVAFLACYLPARHATKVNPVEVLRRE